MHLNWLSCAGNPLQRLRLASMGIVLVKFSEWGGLWVSGMHILWLFWALSRATLNVVTYLASYSSDDCF